MAQPSPRTILIIDFGTRDCRFITCKTNSDTPETFKQLKYKVKTDQCGFESLLETDLCGFERLLEEVMKDHRIVRVFIGGTGGVRSCGVDRKRYEQCVGVAERWCESKDMPCETDVLDGTHEAKFEWDGVRNSLPNFKEFVGMMSCGASSCQVCIHDWICSVPAGIREFRELHFKDDSQLEEAMDAHKRKLVREIGQYNSELVREIEGGTVVLIEWFADLVGAERYLNMGYSNKIPVDEVLRKLQEKEDELKPRACKSSDKRIKEALAIGVLLRVLLEQLATGAELLFIRAVDNTYRPRISWITGLRLQMRDSQDYMPKQVYIFSNRMQRWVEATVRVENGGRLIFLHLDDDVRLCKKDISLTSPFLRLEERRSLFDGDQGDGDQGERDCVGYIRNLQHELLTTKYDLAVLKGLPGAIDRVDTSEA